MYSPPWRHFSCGAGTGAPVWRRVQPSVLTMPMLWRPCNDKAEQSVWAEPVHRRCQQPASHCPLRAPRTSRWMKSGRWDPKHQGSRRPHVGFWGCCNMDTDYAARFVPRTVFRKQHRQPAPRVGGLRCVIRVFIVYANCVLLQMLLRNKALKTLFLPRLCWK